MVGQLATGKWCWAPFLLQPRHSPSLGRGVKETKEGTVSSSPRTSLPRLGPRQSRSFPPQIPPPTRRSLRSELLPYKDGFLSDKVSYPLHLSSPGLETNLL